jgi:hypothetical protein
MQQGGKEDGNRPEKQHKQDQAPGSRIHPGQLVMQEIQENGKEDVKRPEKWHKKDQVPGSEIH